MASRLPLEPQPPKSEQSFCPLSFVFCLLSLVASRLPLEPQPPKSEQRFCPLSFVLCHLWLRDFLWNLSHQSLSKAFVLCPLSFVLCPLSLVIESLDNYIRLFVKSSIRYEHGKYRKCCHHHKAQSNKERV